MIDNYRQENRPDPGDLADHGGPGFDEEYRARAVRQFENDLEAVCAGSGRKGGTVGRRGFALCGWCLNEVAIEGDIGYWMSAHAADFSHFDEPTAQRMATVFDEFREGREVQRQRDE